MKQNKYENLADGIDAEELEPYFEQFMAENETAKDYDKLFSELNELAGRQWHTYELMKPQLLDQFDEWFRLKLCNDEFDFRYIKTAVSKMCMLGLQKSFNELKNLRNKVQNEKVRAIIDEALKYDEIEVKDPYITMRDPAYRPIPDSNIDIDD